MKIRNFFAILLLFTVLSGCLASCNGKQPANGETTTAETAQTGENLPEASLHFSNVTVCTAPSTAKVLMVGDYSSDSQTLTFEAFRNEYEGAQLILHAQEYDVMSYDVTLSDLTCGENVLAKECFSVYNEKYIALPEIYDTLSGNQPGIYPDALLPMDTAIEYSENQIHKGMNQGIWFSVKIPKDQPAGIYTGKFTLTVDGETGEFPVQVTVWDYAISDENHVKSCYAAYIDALGCGELSNTVEMETIYTETLLNYRLNPQDMPIGLGASTDPSDADLRNWVNAAVHYTQDVRCSWIQIPWKRVEGTLPSGTKSTSLIDFDLYKKTLKMALEESLKKEVNVMSKLGMYVRCIDESDYRDKVEDTEYVTRKLHEAQNELYQQYKKELDENGTLWMGFVHKCSAEFIAEVLEDMRTIQHVVTQTREKDARFIFENSPYTRGVMLGEFQTKEARAFAESERDRYNAYYDTDTGEIWCYNGFNPWSPYSTQHIDDDLHTMRALGWIMKQYHFAGHLMWYTNLYYQMPLGYDGKMGELQDCYGSPARYPGSNGDGFIFYPGAPYGIVGPVPSMRLEVLRDSLEDYEVFYLMEQMYRAAAEKNGVNDPDAKFDKLMEMMSTGYYNGVIIQIGDDLTESFATLRESMNLMLRLVDMGVLVTDFEKNANGIRVCFQAPEGVTLSANGKPVEATKSGSGLQYVVTSDLGESETVSVSASDGSKTVEGTFWFGAKQTVVPAKDVADILNIGTASSGSYVEKDDVCGQPVYRINIASGRQEMILNVSNLGIAQI